MSKGIWCQLYQWKPSGGPRCFAKSRTMGTQAGGAPPEPGRGLRRFVQGFAANAVGAAAGLVSQDAFGPVGSPDGFLQRTAVAAIGGGLAADHAMYFLNRDWQISGFMVLVSMCSTLLPMIERRQCSARRWHGSSSG